MTVLILETLKKVNVDTVYVDIGGLNHVEILTLAADLDRAHTFVGVVDGVWARPHKDLRYLFPLVCVTSLNLWRFTKISPQLKHALLILWGREVQGADLFWSRVLTPKLEKARHIFMSSDQGSWTRFSLIE